MRRLILIALLISAAPSVALSAQQPATQQQEAERIATREQLRKLLDAASRKGIGISFRQSEKQPFNFVGVLTSGLVNAESLEVVVGVTKQNTVNFRIYPHFKGGYINIDKARNSVGLMRLLLNLSDRSFLFWGADPSGDAFAGYTFTLESGFPDKAMEIVLLSIPILDKFVGEMRPLVDGSAAVVAPAK